MLLITSKKAVGCIANSADKLALTYAIVGVVRLLGSRKLCFQIEAGADPVNALFQRFSMASRILLYFFTPEKAQHNGNE